MGLGPSAIKLNLELLQRGFFKDIKSIAEIGSQELHLPQADFEALVEAAGIDPIDQKRFRNLGNWPNRPRCSAKDFYELLGVEEYTCIDLNQEYGAKPHDLNMPLEDSTLLGRFDLVTDYGSNEHAFNIAEAYRTLHRLCKPKGKIIIMQAVSGGNGYYNFDLSFFEGIAAANQYRILFSSYIVAIGSETVPSQFHIPLSRDLLKVIDWGKVNNIGICYVLEKQAEADFQIPYQGPYLSQKQGNDGYRIQFLQDPPRRTYVPVVRADLDQLGGAQLVRTLLRKSVRKAKSFFRR